MNRYMAITVVAIITIFNTSCTTYKDSANSFFGGYSHTQLSYNIFMVNFKGNAYISKEKVKDFALLRSAEITIENGFSYFVLADASDYVKIYTQTTPITASTTGNAQINGSSHISYNSQTNFSGGDTVTYHKSRSSNTIICYDDKPKDLGIMVFDAEFIIESIKDKYNINTNQTNGNEL